MRWLGLVLGLAVALSARAQLLAPINPAKTAEVNGKVLDLQRVNANTIAPAQYPTKEVAVTGQRIATSIVDTALRPVQLLDLGLRPTSTVPQQNFAAKRAAVSDQVLSFPMQPTPGAAITNRVIDLRTPAGQAELREQLNARH